MNDRSSSSEAQRSPHSLILYMHPLASYCQKVLVALYETGVPFQAQLVDLGNATERANLQQLWPIGKFPVLRDVARNETIPESSIIIEYLTQYYPGESNLLPVDADLSRVTRLRDRFYDQYVEEPMQKIVGDRLRPPGKTDPHGVEHAKGVLRIAYSMIDQQMAGKTWANGAGFSMADCGAAPALFYANKVLPFADAYPNVAAYFERLLQRPSYARVLREAQPYMGMFPE
jgi:glutathione S-transferase